jgi:hypothetical protein
VYFCMRFTAKKVYKGTLFVHCGGPGSLSMRAKDLTLTFSPSTLRSCWTVLSCPCKTNLPTHLGRQKQLSEALTTRNGGVPKEVVNLTVKTNGVTRNQTTPRKPAGAGMEGFVGTMHST